jgi:hypothetical protein
MLLNTVGTKIYSSTCISDIILKVMNYFINVFISLNLISLNATGTISKIKPELW